MTAKPSPQEALIYLMVVMSAVDRDMTDAELGSIGRLVRTLPAFDGFDQDRILHAARECQQLLQRPDGPEHVLNLVRDTVPAELHDTAYSLAVDVVAADLYVEPEELRMLQIVRRRLKLDPLVAAAIERAARARYRAIEAAVEPVQ